MLIKTLFIVGMWFLSESGNVYAGSTTTDSLTVKKHQYDTYTVLEKTCINSSFTDVIVLSKSKSSIKKSCTDTTFVLKQQENGFFITLVKTFLFMDYGTGPDARTLKVFDITSKKTVIDTLYSDSLTTIGNDTVVIWLESADTTVSKCPEYPEWESHGLGAAIINKHYFDLNRVMLYKTEQWKCTPRQ